MILVLPKMLGCDIKGPKLLIKGYGILKLLY